LRPKRANIVGAIAVVRTPAERSRVENMVALSAGFMVSVALLDLAPDAIKTQGVRRPGDPHRYLLVHFTQHTLAPAFPFRRRSPHVTKMVSFSALAG